MAKKKCRVLVTTTIGSVVYQPDQVINIEAALAKPHVVGGALDDCKEAVAYALEQGAVVVEHSAAAAEVLDPEQSEEAAAVALAAELAAEEAAAAAAAVAPIDEASSTQQ